jgi:hypothetical protein
MFMAKYYTNSDGPDLNAHRAAIQKIEKETESSRPRIAIIALISKEHINNFTHIFNDNQIRQFLKKDHVSINEVDFYLWSTSSSEELPFDCPVLILGGSLDVVSAVQQRINTTIQTVIFVPWTNPELKEYVSLNPDAICIYPKE